MPTNESQYTDLVKSVSKFVIKEKHQTTNKGDVYEQDIFTIDGRTLYDKNKKTVYKSGNFIITASNEQVAPMPPSDIVWETPPNSDCVEWTWEDVEDVNEEDDTSVSLELKPDIFDLRTFAYYGSCSELIRASLNHIISTFPGEVYASSEKLVYLDKSGDTEQYSELGKDDFIYVVDNPFGLNLHEKDVESYFIDKDPLKYLLPDDFYMTAYSLIYPDSDEEHTITEMIYEYYLYVGEKETHKNIKQGGLLTRENKVGDKTFEEYLEELEKEGLEIVDCVPPYSQMGILTINDDIEVHVWKLKGADYAYLTNETGWHIRPKKEYYTEFRKNLSLFEKVLLSEETLPKYSPYFEILTETDYGFSSQMQRFQFPIDPYGKYNLDVNSMAYTTYSSSLSTIGESYDEIFCDNLYRSMTHEAITNFDWSFQKERNETIESQNREGGTVMQKILRLIAREFDDIKLYIEGIKDSNKLTYSGNGNLPDYLLTDYVENEGWDYNHIIPFVKKELYKLTKEEGIKYSWLEKRKDKLVDNEGKEVKDVGEIITDINTNKPIYSFPKFTESLTPYNFTPTTDECSDKIDFIEKVRTHTNSVEYTPEDINNHFAKLLALNSKAIWRRKGTIEAIESLLGLFGLKSKDWVESLNEERANFNPIKSCGNGEEADANTCPNREKYSTISNDYDYEVIEYSYKDIKGVFDENETKYNSDDYLGTLKERKLWLDVNEKKYIGYEEDTILETPHTNWRGLLLKEKTYYKRDSDRNIQKDGDGNPIVDHYTLYPWFDKNAENDGNPYYQMYGGWMKRTNSLGELTQSYNTENGANKTNITDDLVTIPYYTESIAKVRGVETLKELMSLSKSILNDGDICYVSDLSRNFIIIDGIPYELSKYKTKQKNEKNEWVYSWVKNWYYLDVTVKNKSIVLGTKIYRDSLHTIEPVLEDGKPKFKDLEETIPVIANKIKPLKQYSDGAIVKILINNTIKFIPSDSYGTITNNTIFITPEKLGFTFTEEEELCCKSVKCSEGYGKRIGEKSRLGTHYFMLTNVKYSNYLNMANDSTVSNYLGWNQLSENSPEYKHIKLIKNNYSGNNPHTHKIESDSGQAYIQYFANLFKYSTDNNLIDWNVLYENYGKNTYNEQSKFMKDVKSFGFKKLIKNNDICAVNLPTNDIKVWVSNKRDDEGNYLLELTKDNFIDSDSIMNTKLVKIIFKCAPELTDKFKYINDVVLHYLEQILPSTIIVKIEYAQ